ncbi:MAG: YHYH protein [Phycisphaerales bacterium]|nr:YHYH protein [Phycisphaerales bacterium]
MRTTKWMIVSVLATTGVSAGAGNGLGCDGDATRDGTVNTDDILEIVNLWGEGGFDIDGDGICGVTELLAALHDWDSPCHPFHDVPGLSVELNYDTGMAIITSTNVPAHPTGPFDGSTGCFNPNPVTAQNDTWEIPLVPFPTDNPQVVYFEQMGQVGVMLNGTTYYNPYDAGGIDAPSTICMDDYYGHPSPDGRYHYHQAPAWAMNGQIGHSMIIGYSFDGYPVYGPFESTGVYAMDLTGDMALDACNGHEDDIRGYHYHAVAFSDRPDGFPWIQGCYRGEPVMSNFTGGGGGGGGCDGCAQNMIPPPVCHCVHTTPGYEYCCDNWDANCQAFADQNCGGP